MKKALLKDSIKEIKNNYKRFLSILLMAFLGVGFFAGMRVTSPDMVDTIDKYYTDNHVYDIQILSTLGLTNDDIEAMSKINNIETVIGTYELDGKLETDNKEIITKIMCIEELNQPILLQGEFPKNQDECVVEEKFLTDNHKKIGDTIEVEVENTKNDNGEEVEYLNKTTLKIVGTVKSPLYISRDRGTSSLGSGKIDYYMYISKENIKANEIYTSLYIKVNDSSKYITSSEKYENYIEEVKQNIENIKKERQQERHNKLVDMAITKVEEAEIEFNSEKQTGQEQIDQAKKEIDDAKSEINKAESKININKKEADLQFLNAYNQIKTAKQTIDENEKQLNAKEQEANLQLSELERQKQELQTQLKTIENGLIQFEIQYNQIKDNPDVKEEEKQSVLAQIQSLKQTKQSIEAGITQINNGITTGKQEIENAKTQLQSAKDELASQEKQYNIKKQSTYNQLENAKLEIEKSIRNRRRGIRSKTKRIQGENS